MKFCVLGFILIVTALVGFSGIASFDEQNWRIALASQQPITEPPPPPEPSRLTLSPRDPHFRRNIYELSYDAMGLAGISLVIVGIVVHVRRTNAAGFPK
jgi:hypothetical protein